MFKEVKNINHIIKLEEAIGDIAGYGTDAETIEKNGVFRIRPKKSMKTSRFVKGLGLAAAAFYAGTASAGETEIDGEVDAIGRSLSNRFNGGDDIFSQRTKLILCADYNINEKLNLGIGGAAEWSSTPTLDSRLSDHDELSIDRVFINYSTGNLQAKFGAFDNTFSGWFERAIPVNGAQVKLEKSDVFGLGHVAIKLAYSMGQPWLHEADNGIYGVEITGEKTFSSVKVNFAVNYMDFGKPDIPKTNSDKDFQIVNSELKFIYDSDGIPIFDGPLAMYAKMMHNLGAERNNDGMILGVQLGNLKEPGDMNLCFQYRHIQDDATLAAYAPRWTPATNFNQPFFVAGRKITDELTLKAFAAFPKRNHGPSERQRYFALELNYRMSPKEKN